MQISTRFNVKLPIMWSTHSHVIDSISTLRKRIGQPPIGMISISPKEGSTHTVSRFTAILANYCSVRDRLIESWNDTNQHFDEMDVKRAYYLSLEYLMGRYFQNALVSFTYQ